MALFDERLAALAFAVSVGTLILGVVLAPLLIARLPADYFAREPSEAEAPRHPFLRGVWLTISSMLGGLLVLAGLAMLVLPGQGALTIVAGLSLLRFPGKRKLQRRLLHLPGIRGVCDAIRRRAGKPPLW